MNKKIKQEYGFIKNTIPLSLVNDVKRIITSFNFTWQWVGEIAANLKTEKYYQFVHVFCHADSAASDNNNLVVESNYFNDIKPLLYFFEQQSGYKIKSVRRIKANLLTRLYLNEEEFRKTFHVDVNPEDVFQPGKKNKKYISVVYYVIDSDGDTVLLDNNLKKIASASPVAGNMFWFESTAVHTATPPITNKRRIIINFVLEVEN